MKKTLILFLLAAMLISSLAIFTGCGGSNASEIPGSTQTTSKVEDTTVLSEEIQTDEWGRPMLEYPMKDSFHWNLETVTFLSRNEDASICQYVEATSQPDILNDATVRRNNLLEEKMGVQIAVKTQEPSASNAVMNNFIRTIVNTQGTDFDAISNFAYYGAALAAEGYYYELGSLTNLQTDQIWWNQSYVEESMINNKLYMIVGDANVRSIMFTYGMFFNKSLANAWMPGVDFYEIVDDGDWTFNFLDEAIKNVYSDTDADNQRTKGDTYGLITSVSSQNTMCYFCGFEMRLTERSELTGLPELALNTEVNRRSYEMINNHLYHNDGAFIMGTLTDDFRAAIAAFADGRSLFNTGMLGSGASFTMTMTDGFGLLPMPKRDEEQKEYITSVQDSYDFIALPSSLYRNKERAEMVAAVVDYLSYLSRLTTNPTYFEVITKLRYSNESNDARMYDIICGNIYYDFGYIYSASILGATASLAQFLTTTMRNGADQNFISEYGKNASAYETNLTNILDMLLE